MDTPQLSRLSWEVRFKHSEGFPDDWIDDAIRPGSSYSSLTHLELVTRRRSSPESGESPLPSIFRAFDNVQHVSLQTPGIDFGEDFPPIWSLRLTDCDQIHGIGHQLKKLTADGGSAWEHFELLSVQGCRRIKEKDLSKFLPKEKYRWTPTIISREAQAAQNSWTLN